ncbi:MAG TPA: OmpA family protein [Castellaniella sp.]|uniref:OmpA family protein n=1 Tax=Castellaniella sp. TaxID=1955812 RepID=UPI002EEDDD1D
MRRYPGELQPAQAIAQRMQSLQAELQQARRHLQRERRNQEPGVRWGLGSVDSQPQGEEWLITYLDMVTLLMVAMIMMLALSGSLHKPAEAASSAKTPHGPTLSSDLRTAPPSLVTPGPETEAHHTAAPADPPAQESDPAVPTLAPLAGTFPDPTLPLQPNEPEVLTPTPSEEALPSSEKALPPAEEALPLPAPAPATTPEATAPPPSALPPAAEPAAVELSEPTKSSSPVPAPAASDAQTEGETVAASLALGELGKDVEVVVNKRSVSFRINSEILFGTGQTDLSDEGLAVLKRTAQVLVNAGYDITVEGHTDSVPLRSGAAYPSNWELSSARASRVVRYLQANGIAKSHLKAVGFADSDPIADNGTPEGRARNRRVELVVAKHRDE